MDGCMYAFTLTYAHIYVLNICSVSSSLHLQPVLCSLFSTHINSRPGFKPSRVDDARIMVGGEGWQGEREIRVVPKCEVQRERLASKFLDTLQW